MDGETCPHKLASVGHFRLLLYIVVPTVSLLAGLLLLALAVTGIHINTHTHTHGKTINRYQCMGGKTF